MDILDTPFDNDGVTIKQFLRATAIVLVLASLPAGYWAWLRERDLNAIRTHWVETNATVIRGLDKVGPGGRRAYREHHYYLTLRWTDEAGRELTIMRGTNRGLFSGMASASPEARQVRIRYLPGRPDIAPIVTTDFVDTQNIYLMSAVAMLGLGLGAAWFVWPPRRKMAAA